MKNLRPAIETVLVRLATWALPQFPRPLIILLGQIFGSIAYLVDYRGRTTAKTNLYAAFSDQNITPDQVRRITIASYHTFARTFLDLFWSLRLTRDNIDGLFHDHPEVPQAISIAKQKGAIWVTPHFGNFELISLIMGFRDVPLIVVAQNFKNPSLTTIFTRLRQNSGHRVIPQQGAMLRLMKELKRGGHVALLTDLTIKPNKTAAAIECFGLKTCVTTLHASLSQRLDLPIVAGLCTPFDDGSYHFQFKILHPTDYPTPAAMSQAAWDHFEIHIRQRPECWLWMYKHWRYLPGLEPDPKYPDYANTSRPFRDMLGQVKREK
ncbi:lysophospholipid acyltransferase family protein [Phragmitibacter flavus]|uniref:Lysophospholipid acyltransferase family protein n=1 Tax=Phragmitibacter flavus TaxID=2576071 RepID=A0A5R8KEV4_9BACT|nr:lysophospholipid acyltransferase family protein [Phragmitibacter flavus]TLD70824.1 lysophospholipid acyltransferase family protein [Phragmitibacter flavus]